MQPFCFETCHIASHFFPLQLFVDVCFSFCFMVPRGLEMANWPSNPLEQVIAGNRQWPYLMCPSLKIYNLGMS